jgi:hypothetical protein
LAVAVVVVVGVVVAEPVEVVVDVAVGVDGVGDVRSAVAWCCAAATSASELARGLSFLIACPRLIGADVVVVGALGGVVGALGGVVGALGGGTVDPGSGLVGFVVVPSIAALRSANGILRFFDTCSAATN